MPGCVLGQLHRKITVWEIHTDTALRNYLWKGCRGSRLQTAEGMSQDAAAPWVIQRAPLTWFRVIRQPPDFPLASHKLMTKELHKSKATEQRSSFFHVRRVWVNTYRLSCWQLSSHEVRSERTFYLYIPIGLKKFNHTTFLFEINMITRK